MQNKGAVRTFAILLALVCLYQLSFTYFTKKAESDAKAYAAGDPAKEYAYLDSLANEPIYNFLFLKEYTYRECKGNEINFGLDLKGGMNLVLEVKVADIVKALSNYNQNEIFLTAVKNAEKKEETSTKDFITLFAEEFEALDPNAQLATIFSTVELKGLVKYDDSNADVVKVLRSETEGAISNAFNILRTRIDRFGVTQPNIQRLEKAGRVLVELPGVTDPQRVRDLLQGTASLEFWETYNNDEIINNLIEANQVTTTTVAADTTKAAAPADSTDSSLALLSQVADSLPAAQPTVKSLFSVLTPMPAGFGPVVGVALAKDTAEVNAYLAEVAAKKIFPNDLRLMWTVKPIEGERAQQLIRKPINPKDPVFQLIAIKSTSLDGRAPLDGEAITNARSQVGDRGSAYEVSMTMNSEGAKTWARLTKANKGRSIAVVLDGFVYSFPTVQNEITGGNSQITGDFTPEEAQDLANVLKSGKLPAPARIVEDTVVGPSLGQEAIDSGLLSFIFAFIVVLIYMVAFYGYRAGLVADFALLSNLFFIFGVLASFGAVLTLPGLAGIVLTIGMAVDANVITFERIREEMRLGKGVQNAVAEGYRNAMSAIVDSNITTLLTAIILFSFGTGPIKGFATTLMIGIITSFFTAVFMSRLFIERLAAKHDDMKFYTPLTKNFMQGLNIDFLKNRKAFYAVIGAVMLVCVGSLTFRGLKSGIDFTGGQVFVVRFEQPVSSVDIQSSLHDVFENSNVEVKTYGGDNQVRIATNYGFDNHAESAQEEIETKLYEGLRSFLPESVGKEQFLADYRMSSQKVGPTMASDMKENAIYSIIFSLIVMFVYIFFRFRNWAYGMGAVVALTHDVVFTLGIFSLTYSIMPFSMEIDQSFVAAILTIVGYSINNTVVIFDRIRESFNAPVKVDARTAINTALNSTMGRTLNTSLTTLVTLIVIFVFGGEAIRGFVFAMTIGIFVGTFSSLLLATPLAYEWIARKEKKQARK